MNRILNYADGIMLTNDVDTSTGRVKFYYANFETPDRYGRQMHTNAFNRTTKNNLDKIYHLNNHNDLVPIGKPIEFGKDNKGAWVVSQLSKNSDGQKALTLYQEGVYKYHSFGFYIINSTFEGDIEQVQEARIVEVSTVLYPAHTDATTISLNSEQNNIITKLDVILAHLNADSNPSDIQVRNTIQFINNYKH